MPAEIGENREPPERNTVNLRHGGFGVLDANIKEANVRPDMMYRRVREVIDRGGGGPWLAGANRRDVLIVALAE